MEIQLTQDKVAIVDDDDYAELSKYKWYAHKPNPKSSLWYARRSFDWNKETKQNDSSISMHQQIMGTFRTGVGVDHINHNGLDNRRINLRKANTVQNQRHAYKRTNKTSSVYKGVNWYRNKWRAYIGLAGKNKWLGTYSSEIDAAKAYNQAALEYFGEFAQLNIISSSTARATQDNLF